MKGPTTRNHTTLGSQQWPGATLAQSLSGHMPKTSATRSKHPGKVLPRSQLEPTKQSAWRLLLAEQETQLHPKYPFLQAALARKAKRGLNIRGVVSWQPTGRQGHFPELYSPSSITGPDSSLACCGNSYIFPKRKSRQRQIITG